MVDRKKSKAGRKGGKNGRGDAKRREPEFYSVFLPKKRAEARAKREQK